MLSIVDIVQVAAGFRHTNSPISYVVVLNLGSLDQLHNLQQTNSPISYVVVLNLGSLDQLHNLQQISKCVYEWHLQPRRRISEEESGKVGPILENFCNQNPFDLTFTSDPALAAFLQIMSPLWDQHNI